MKQVYRFIQRIFSLSYHESKGFFVLFLVSLVALSLLIFPKLLTRHNIEVNATDTAYLDSLVAVLPEEKHTKSMTLFNFDPNKLSVDSLLLLGLPKKTATIWENFRTKGGRFRVKSDVQKIYGISEEWVQKAYPYIQLPDSNVYIKPEKQKLDLNRANTNQLKSIPNIGEVNARRIVAFRRSLGGFVQIDQVQEVYEISNEAVASISSQVYISPDFTPEKIRINHDEKEKLLSHPYISKNLAEDIIRFREINKSIESEKVLSNFKSVDKRNFEKLILYLEFQ